MRLFISLTSLFVGAGAVSVCFHQRRCEHWKVENEGSNRQKNSGLNLEHVYSTNPEEWKIY